MSYCRFRNTVNDLDDCYETLSNEDFSEMSMQEQRAAIRLVKMCQNIADDFIDDVDYWEDKLKDQSKMVE